MDRQAHEYAAMAFVQQQQAAQQHQQFGFLPHNQQFSPHGPPFLPPHPSLQQFPFHRHLQQHIHPQQHLLHLQQPQSAPGFPPQLAPHHGPPFHGPFDSAPPPAVPPLDPQLHKVIDKLVEYIARNGPQFEAMVREKELDNPTYSFLFGGEGHSYYRYMLWVTTRPSNAPFNPSMMNPAGPQHHQPTFPPFFDQQQLHNSQPFMGHGRQDYDSPSSSFKGISGPLPSDVAAELSNMLTTVTGTKESIKGAKAWFMQRFPFAPALAEAFKERVFALEDSERQMHIIYVANDILFESLQRRANLLDLDNGALAFKPVLGAMLSRVYHNPHNKEANQSRLQKMLEFWGSKDIYDPDTIYGLESEMISGTPASYVSVPLKDSSGTSAEPQTTPGLLQTTASQSLDQWRHEGQRSFPPGSHDHELLGGQIPPAMPMTSIHQQLLPSSQVAGAPFIGSLPIASSAQPINQLMPAPTSNIIEKLPPYPLFPPGLIPGMVRKMQIGSGVPYSPMSPLDIPTVIPTSTISPSDILERVSKFFKEIGEVNPSEGRMKSSKLEGNDDDDDVDDVDDAYERNQSNGRKGGACIPPPANLQQVDPETGTYADGTVERKPGASGSSGRLGLGATANPNEVSQYDDVYSSYRKHRSTNYHTSMSVRAATR